MGTRYPTSAPVGAATTFRTRHERFTPAGGTNTVTLLSAPINSPDGVIVFQNGVLQRVTTDYSYTGSVITFTNNFTAGDSVDTYYAYLL